MSLLNEDLAMRYVLCSVQHCLILLPMAFPMVGYHDGIQLSGRKILRRYNFQFNFKFNLGSQFFGTLYNSVNHSIEQQ